MKVVGMDDKSLAGLFSANPSGEAGDGQEQDSLLAASLKAVAAGSSNEAVEDEIGAFLKGEGNLLETASAALTRGGGSAATDVAKFLEEKFGLNPAIARVIGTLLINLLPGIKKKKAAKKKPTKKPATSAKTPAKKKPKKTAAKPKKPVATAKAKKKPTAKKETAKAKPKPKTKPKKRVETIEA
jgi:outer membrane biosynthesis protein TonB